MGNWYDREGKPLPDVPSEWERRLMDPGYRRVAETTLPDGRWVSTVWLGLDHNWGTGGPPLIFETMVFGSDGESDLYCERYATEAEAKVGHARVVELLALGRDPGGRVVGLEPCPERVIELEG